MKVEGLLWESGVKRGKKRGERERDLLYGRFHKLRVVANSWVSFGDFFAWQFFLLLDAMLLLHLDVLIPVCSHGFPSLWQLLLKSHTRVH